MARKCYLTSVDIEKVHQTLMVEDRRNIAEPQEEMEDIALVTRDEKKIAKVGMTLLKEIKDGLIIFLRNNANVFAWSHEDMLGISREVMAHKLNMNLSMHPVKQKRRLSTPKRNAAVMEEVEKLFTA